MQSTSLIFTLKFIFLSLFIFCSLYASSEEVEEFKKAVNYFEKGEFEKAERIFQLYSDKAHAESFFYLGLIYDPEYNKPPFQKFYPKYDEDNDSKVKSYYQKANRLGSNYAKYQLGKYYRTLASKRENFKLSDKLWKEAIKGLSQKIHSDDWLAQYMLADMSRNKFKINSDFPKVEALLLNEAKSGNRFAQFYLGKYYSQWTCRTDKCKDYSKALAWFLVSSKSGSYHSTQYLVKLIKIMEEKEIEKGTTLAEKIMNEMGIK